MSEYPITNKNLNAPNTMALPQLSPFGLHAHMLAVINTELKRFSEGSVVKILDVCCG